MVRDQCPAMRESVVAHTSNAMSNSSSSSSDEHNRFHTSYDDLKGSRTEGNTAPRTGGGRQLKCSLTPLTEESALELLSYTLLL